MGPTAETPFVCVHQNEFEKERTGVRTGRSLTATILQRIVGTHMVRNNTGLMYLVHGFLS